MVIWANKEGTLRIWKKDGRFILKEYSIFNLMGNIICSFPSWECAKAFLMEEMGIKANIGEHGGRNRV